MKYGRRCRGAIAVTGLDYQTLRNYAVVARRFDLSRRRDSLSCQHHAEVCALSDSEQDRWLDLASAVAGPNERCVDRFATPALRVAPTVLGMSCG